MVLPAHRRGGELRRPLPAARRGRRPAARSRKRGRGRPARRERAQLGARLLRRRGALGQPGPPLAGLRHRHHRCRALHAAHHRPRRGRDRGRDRARRLLRPVMGERQRDRLLCAHRRRHAPVPVVAAPHRHRTFRRHPGARGDRRALHPLDRPHQGRPLRRHRAPEHPHERGVDHPSREPRRRARLPGTPSGGHRVHRRPSPGRRRRGLVGATHQRGRGRLPAPGGGRRRHRCRPVA